MGKSSLPIFLSSTFRHCRILTHYLFKMKLSLLIVQCKSSTEYNTMETVITLADYTDEYTAGTASRACFEASLEVILPPKYDIASRTLDVMRA